MKYKIILLLSLCLLYIQLPVNAQPPRGRFSPQEYAKQLESFIAQEACLTPSESNIFFPAFHEMRNKQRAINFQIREMKKKNDNAQATEKDYYTLLKTINELKIETIELENSYCKKLCKQMPAKKVYDAIQAEERFNRRMLRKFTNGGPQKRGT